MTDAPEAIVLTRQELEAKIAEKALADADFRAEFLADPTATFVKYGGVSAAQLPRIVVHEEQPGSWHIVLPAKPAANGELSDEELEKVSGGSVLLGLALMATSGFIGGILAGGRDDG